MTLSTRDIRDITSALNMAANFAPVMRPHLAGSSKRLVWGAHTTSYLHQPEALDDGADVSGALYALCGVRTRAKSNRQRIWARVNNGVGGEQLGLKLEPRRGGGAAKTTGEAAMVDGDADLSAAALKTTLDGWGDLAGLNGATANAASDIVSLEVDVGDEEGWSVGASDASDADAGILVEAMNALWRIWGLPHGHSEWMALGYLGDHLVEPNASNRFELIPCGGFDRLFVEVLDCDGLCWPIVTPLLPKADAQATLAAAQADLALATGGEVLTFPSALTGSCPFGASTRSLGSTSLAARLTLAGVIEVNPTTPTIVLPANPRRVGYLLRNSLGETIYRAHVGGGVAAASTTSMPIKDGEVDTRMGATCPSEAISIITTAATGNIWREEWM